MEYHKKFNAIIALAGVTNRSPFGDETRLDRESFSRRLIEGTMFMNGVESVLVMCGPTVAG